MSTARADDNQRRHDEQPRPMALATGVRPTAPATAAVATVSAGPLPTSAALTDKVPPPTVADRPNNQHTIGGGGVDDDDDADEDEHEGGDDESEEAIRRRLLGLLERPENATCADCDAPRPRWATITHGGFICTQCAGVHRALGVHVSFVLSCTLDKWTPTQLRTVAAVGNARLNARLEPRTAVPKPHATSPRLERERFIRAKYAAASDTTTTKTKGPGDERPEVAAAHEDGPRRTSSPAAAAVTTTAAAVAAAGMVEYVGVLVIELLEGVELAGMDINGKSDPYVTFRLGEQAITSQRIDNDVNPRWGQTLLLSWDGAAPLVAEVFDHNTLTNDRFMGSVVIAPETLAPLLQQPAAEIDALYQLWMPRSWAKNFGEHMVAGAEGVTKGLYKGITGVWKDPIRGAKERGLEGFAKGVGTGVAGVVYRPIKGLGTMVKETARSVGVTRKRSVDGGPEELVKAGCLHLKIRLQRF